MQTAPVVEIAPVRAGVLGQGGLAQDAGANRGDLDDGSGLHDAGPPAAAARPTIA